jgi:hypothetical protein
MRAAGAQSPISNPQIPNSGAGPCRPEMPPNHSPRAGAAVVRQSLPPAQRLPQIRLIGPIRPTRPPGIPSRPSRPIGLIRPIRPTCPPFSSPLSIFNFLRAAIAPPAPAATLLKFAICHLALPPPPSEPEPHASPPGRPRRRFRTSQAAPPTTRTGSAGDSRPHAYRPLPFDAALAFAIHARKAGGG